MKITSCGSSAPGERLTLDAVVDSIGRPVECSFRRCAVLIDASIHEYVRCAGLKQAFELIESGDKIEAVMHLVGYRNRTSFFREFRFRFGVLPGEIKRAVSSRGTRMTEVRA